MKAPIPDTPAKLYGSFNHGRRVQPDAIMADFLRRVELTTDPVERLLQAQRTIGALMALVAFDANGTGALFHKSVFARLAALTGVSQVELVTSAGVAR